MRGCALAAALSLAAGAWASTAAAQAADTEPATQTDATLPGAGAPEADGDAGAAEAELADSWSVPIVHGLGLMTVMRVTEAVIWPEPFADLNPGRVGERYEAAFTQPPKWDGSARAFEWDGDPWWLNAGGHALFGSELYLRSRICRRNVLEALLLTTAGSTLWEYGFEANGVRPSGLDLWYTPLSGLVLGELRYQGFRAARRLGAPGWRGVFTTVLDPLGQLERALGTPC